MKKFVVLITGAFLLMNTAFAGGLLTNTNQSAQFVRMLSRNASTDLDAVYFNPAGLMQMNNGFYFGLDNQSIFQTRTITNDFIFLKNRKVIQNEDKSETIVPAVFKGETTVPAFPSAFAVYKVDKWAFSAGFGPNAGGGTAKYSKGLPSFEIPISAIPSLLKLSGVPTTDYSAAINFEGSSVFWGAQLNGSYAINDMISVSAGVRMISAKNTYSGYIKDININPNLTAYGFDGSMRTASSVFTTLSGASTKGANDIQPYVTAASSATLAQLVASTKMDQATADKIANGLGINSTSTLTISQIQAAYNAKASYLASKSAGTADQSVDAEQTGMGFTPIIGVDIHLDKLNWGIKYEHKTSLGLTTKNNKSTTEDRTGKFPDGSKIHNDIPAILATGIDYMVTDKLKASGSFNYYFDKGVNWGVNTFQNGQPNEYSIPKTIDKNYTELSLGLEYKLTDNFAVSAGYLNSNTGVSKDYQSDLSYSNDSYTVGMGFQWNVTEKLVLDAGALITTYKDYSKLWDDQKIDIVKNFGSYTDTYGKKNLAIAVGIGYQISGSTKSKSKGRRR
jgi:long-chain fatty acid transport protein